ncbi:hypothetical protein FHS43_003455 [Streptosporangium becharense]|uniref:Nuclear transport factor 2 family protein n=1 Tax=Streptosporangium becharense TaxID=1816182 RepID=A0A7W9IDJ9_9ACTN|nr:nuclear transport factor 2 family protein [Streptosporangium becharense]MBB2912175.1 hypothetical protein [Streptosporangium becharense]MBB5818722.1 hypothetical protein [Streptosporangium becharense]
MTETQGSPFGSGSFTPTAEDLASVEAWFAEYDAHSAKVDVERMADMAMFPLNVVTDSPGGDGLAAQWTREQFMRTMAQAMGGAETGDGETGRGETGGGETGRGETGGGETGGGETRESETGGGETGGMEMTSTRTPHFLTGNLVVVVTDATVTMNGQTYDMRYADLLVKSGGRWVFQTMVQGGWAHVWNAAPQEA